MAEVRAARGRKDGGRLRVLDSLRFVAALAVVLFHYTGRNSPAWGEGVRQVFPTVSRFTIYGDFGPYLFFMISGFVVLMSAWGRPVHAFVASRVGRLYPAYWLAVLGTAAVVFLDQRMVPVWKQLGFAGVGINLTMFQSAFGVGHVDGVYWTLWVELKFYLLLAVMAMIGITRARMMALCLVWPLLGALATQTHSDLLATLLEPSCAPYFCMGILLYLVYRDGWSLSAGVLLAMNYLFALWIGKSFFLQSAFEAAGYRISFKGVAVLLTLCLAAMIVATLTPVARIEWRWLTVLGAITYPLYLIHEYPGWEVIRQVGGRIPPHVLVPALVTGMVLLAYLVHRVVERPLGPRLRRAVERDLARHLPQRVRGEAATGSIRSFPAVPVARHAEASSAAARPHPVAVPAVSRRRRDDDLAFAPAE
jgi:peptidoglycan/LPS O-acetylase OafA/YrhL